jgi:hypothetical protein
MDPNNTTKKNYLSAADHDEFIERAKSGEGDTFMGSCYICDPNHARPIRVDTSNGEYSHACYVPWVGY